MHFVEQCLDLLRSKIHVSKGFFGMLRSHEQLEFFTLPINPNRSKFNH